MKKNIHKLIVVLGMHRSGTSAVTRGLQVMGVDLGENLLPPQADNVTGFWEDVDLNALNIEMLHSINSDWHSLIPIKPTDVNSLSTQGYSKLAIALLQEKMSGVDVFGFKDPRVAKLLPFWKEVFLQNQLKVSFVLVIRNPLSVCRSLEKRHGFDFEKSSVLWLEYVISSLAGIADTDCVVVDYDHFVQSPDGELQRIANVLELQINPVEFEKFKDGFLSKELRHTVYDMDDLQQVSSILPLVKEVYSELLLIAEDRIQLKNESFQIKISHWNNEYARLQPILVLADRLNSTAMTLTAKNSELTAKNSELTANLVEKEIIIESLQTQLDHDRQVISVLNQQVNSKAFKLALWFQKIRLIIIPPSSFLEKSIRWAYKSLILLRSEGLIALLRRAKNRILGHQTNFPFQFWITRNGYLRTKREKKTKN